MQSQQDPTVVSQDFTPKNIAQNSFVAGTGSGEAENSLDFTTWYNPMDVRRIIWAIEQSIPSSQREAYLQTHVFFDRQPVTPFEACMIYCRDMLKASDKKYFPFIIKPEKAAAHFTAGILRKDDDGNIKLFYFNPLGYSTPAELKNAEKRLMLDNIASLDSMQLICSPHKIQNVRLDGGGLVSCGPLSVMFIEYALKNPAWIDSLTDEFTLPPNLSQFIDDDQETYQTRLGSRAK